MQKDMGEPVLVETDKHNRKRKIYSCPNCGEELYVSSSRYFCMYCNTTLRWPEDKFRKFNKISNKNAE